MFEQANPLVEHCIATLKTYTSEMLMKASLSDTSMNFFVKLSSLIRALEYARQMDTIFGIDIEEHCLAIKVLSDTSSQCRLTKDVAQAVQRVDSLRKACVVSAGYVIVIWD